jgi:hypothetical protein
MTPLSPIHIEAKFDLDPKKLSSSNVTSKTKIENL